MDEDYKLEGLLVCDDIRQEVSGKEILIGVYNDEMIVKEVPFVRFTLAIKLILRFAKNDSKKFSFLTKDPGGVEMMNVSGETPAPSQYGRVVLNMIAAAPMQFNHAGEHSFWLSVDNAEAKKIGAIVVRLPLPGEKLA